MKPILLRSGSHSSTKSAAQRNGPSNEERTVPETPDISQFPLVKDGLLNRRNGSLRDYHRWGKAPVELAEAAGFEPARGLTLNPLSRRAP